MNSSLDPQDREFLDRLHQLGSATIQEMCASLEVTATAIRTRLVRLEGKGLIVRETVRAGRGRPHHTYSLSTQGLRELGDNYSDLAMILWREVVDLEDQDLREAMLERIKAALIQRYRSGISGRTVLERFVELRDALANRGFNVSVDSRGDLPILQENHCPYHDLASHDASICEMEHSVFEELLGTPIRRTSCFLDGNNCCEFEPVLDSA
jgi:predicted ArsR family transcriptional regulator